MTSIFSKHGNTIFESILCSTIYMILYILNNVLM